MFYFLPDWGQHSHQIWDNTPEPWYQQNQPLAFDDTISQVTMLHAAGKDVKLLIKSYTPFLRSFLHQENSLEVPYESLFDDLQQVSGTPMRSLAFEDLTWPPQI